MILSLFKTIAPCAIVTVCVKICPLFALIHLEIRSIHYSVLFGEPSLGNL